MAQLLTGFSCGLLVGILATLVICAALAVSGGKVRIKDHDKDIRGNVR